jgi:hypothetical protein
LRAVVHVETPADADGIEKSFRKPLAGRAVCRVNDFRLDAGKINLRERPCEPFELFIRKTAFRVFRIREMRIDPLDEKIARLFDAVQQRFKIISGVTPKRLSPRIRQRSEPAYIFLP